MDTYTDAEGNLHSYLTSTGKEIEQISKKTVYNAALQLSKNDPNFNALQSFNYDNAKYDQYADKNKDYMSFKPYDENDRAALFTANFLGSQYNEKDLNPKIMRMPDGNSGSGSGSKKKDENLNPNPITEALNDVDNNGVGTVYRIDALASMANGSHPDEKEGTFNLNTTDKPILLSIPGAGLTSTEQQINQVKINVVGAIQNAKNELKDTKKLQSELYKTVAKENLNYVPHFITRGASDSGEMDMEIREKPSTKGANAPMYGKLIKTVKSEDLLNYALQGYPEYIRVKKLAEEHNLNIESPEFTKETEKIASDPNTQIIYDLGVAIKSGRGVVKFAPLAEENIFAGNNGKDYMSGSARLDGKELVSLLSNSTRLTGKDPNEIIKQAISSGLISELEAPEAGKKGLYEIPINTPISTNIPSATERLYTNGNSEEQKQTRGQFESAENFSTARNIKNMAYNNYKPLFENDFVQFDNNTNVNIQEVEKVDKNSADEFRQQYKDFIEILNNNPSRQEERDAYAGIYVIREIIQELIRNKNKENPTNDLKFHEFETK